MASSSSSFLKKEPMVLRESAGAQHPATWRASPLFDVEEADLCARQRGLQLPHRDGFLVPELKDGSEASKDEQADSSSENNVGNGGNGALFVVGLQGSGDVIAHFLQDWEVTQVALSCHIALDMLCQELHEVERRCGWFGF